MDIFILDHNKKIIDTLYIGDGNNPIFDDKYVRYLTTGAETFECTFVLDDYRAISVVEGNYLLFKYNDKIKLLQIKTAEDEETMGSIQRTIYAEFVGLELANSVVRACTIEGNPAQFMNIILQHTNFKVGYVSETTSEYFATIIIDKPTTVYTVMQNAIADFNNIEYEFEVKCVNSIAGNYEFYINVYADGERGRRTYKRFEYDYNTYGTTRKGDITDFCAGLIATGQNGVTFKDVRWEINRGDPLDKPEGQDFLIDPEAAKMYSNGNKTILGVFEGNSDNGPDLLWETYYKLQEIKQAKYTYNVPVYLSNADYMALEPGDTVHIVNPKFNPQIQLEGRLNTITISFSNPDDSEVEIANFKEVKSKIRQLSSNDIVGNAINALLNLGVGKLSENDIALVRQLLGQLDNEKADVNEIIKEIIAVLQPPIPQLPDSIPEDSEDYTKITVSQLDGGLWIGDDRIYNIIKYGTATTVKEDEISIERPEVIEGGSPNQPSEANSQEYKEAVSYYADFWLGQKATDTTLNNVINGTDKYKIGVMVRYWCNRFGLDERLVYALMMQESSMNPSAATSTSAGGYGLMQCERSVYFNKTQTITYADGTTSTFTPSYSTMQPGKGGNTTVNGVTVDKNINNQIMFGCNELRMNLVKWRYNIFATLIGYNMGIGAMGWIINKYVCDTYGYTFNGKMSLSSCTAEVRTKAYEVLDTFKAPFAPWRQKYVDQGGAGTLKNIEYVLRYYKSDNGQLPYCIVDGKKVGYGVSSTVVNSQPTPPTSNTVRDTIVSMAKTIVSDHVDKKKATYNQSPRTVRYDQPKIWSGTHYGITNPVAYDCSSFVSCCYYAAGLTSVYDKSCSAGTLVKSATSQSGWKAWKCTSANITNYAKPGDIIMDANSTVSDSSIQSNPNYCTTHHTMIYIGNNQVAHASKWANWPSAIKISDISYYVNKGSAFILRPWDLAKADLVQPVEEKPEDPSQVDPEIQWVTDTIIQKYNIVEQTFKGVPTAAASDYCIDDMLVQYVSLYGIADSLEYPLTVPYVFVHFGKESSTEEGIEAYKNLLLTLKAKYPNTPIFVCKDWKANTSYADATTINSQIQNMNDAIAALCNTEEYLIQLDCSSIKDSDGTIKDAMTTDGYHLDTASSTQTYYNAMKDAIKNKRIGGLSKTMAYNNLYGQTNINIVANSNHNYEAGVCNSFEFSIPNFTTAEYWSRFSFSTATSGEPTKFTQPDNVWLTGNDCVEGALIPKAATTYKINLYVSGDSSDYYGLPYFGTVNSTTNDGNYAEFDTFIGGEKVAELANSYYTNRTNLAFITPATTPMYFDNPAEHLTGWKNTSTGVMGIDSQTLCKLCFMGIGFDDSPYANNDMTKVVRNTILPWSFEFPIWAQSQAKYCVQNGWAISDVDLTNFSNLKPGDIIYYCKESNSNYLSLTGIAIYVGNKQAIGVEESTDKALIKFDISESSNFGTRYSIVLVARPRID